MVWQYSQSQGYYSKNTGHIINVVWAHILFKNVLSPPPWLSFKHAIIAVSSILFIMSFLTVSWWCSMSPVWLRTKRDVIKVERWFGKTTTATDDVVTARHHTVTIAPTATAATTATTASMWSVYTDRIVWLPTSISAGFSVCQQGPDLYVLLIYSADVLFESKGRRGTACYLSVARIVSSLSFSKRWTLVSCTPERSTSLVAIITYTKASKDTSYRSDDGSLFPVAMLSFTHFSLRWECGRCRGRHATKYYRDLSQVSVTRSRFDATNVSV